MTEQAAAAALKAINAMTDAQFSEMQSIMTQFKWTTFYFVENNLFKARKDDFKYVDPRWAYESSKKDSSPQTQWINFAVTYQPEHRFLYVDSEYHSGNFKEAALLVKSGVDQTSGKFLHEGNSQTVLGNMFGGIIYLSKWKNFLEYCGTVHGINENTIVRAKNIVSSVVDEQKAKIGAFVGMSDKDLKEINGGFFCEQASYCGPELKASYLNIKTEYEKKIKELYEIMRASPSLTVCFNEATTGDINATNNENMNVYTDITQVLNCAGDELGEISDVMSYDELNKLVKKLQLDVEKCLLPPVIDKHQDKLIKQNKLLMVCVSVVLAGLVGTAIYAAMKKNKEPTP